MPQARFKDSIRLPTKNSAVLMTVISLGSQLQQGQKFKQFVDLVNREYKEKRLEKLLIVTTGHLQKHYLVLDKKILDEKSQEKKAEAFDQEWINKNKPCLDQLKLPIEIITWKELLNREKSDLPAFIDFKNQIEAEHKNSSEFRNLVNEHAASYVAKKIANYSKGNNTLSYDDFLKVSINYILEECAAVLQLFKCGADLITYPGGMNPPARHVWNKYFQDMSLKYVRYEIKGKVPLVQQHSSSLFKTNHIAKDYALWILGKENWNEKQQFQFIKNLNHLIANITQSQFDEPNLEKARISHRRSI